MYLFLHAKFHLEESGLHSIATNVAPRSPTEDESKRNVWTEYVLMTYRRAEGKVATAKTLSGPLQTMGVTYDSKHYTNIPTFWNVRHGQSRGLVRL